MRHVSKVLYCRNDFSVFHYLLSTVVERGGEERRRGEEGRGGERRGGERERRGGEGERRGGKEKGGGEGERRGGKEKGRGGEKERLLGKRVIFNFKRTCSSSMRNHTSLVR